MKSYLYYLKYNGKYLNWSDSNYGSNEDTKRPLIVNCASCVNTPEQHKNSNAEGRLDYLFMYVIEGSFNVSTPLGTCDLQCNNVIVIPPKTSYEIDCMGEKIYFLTVHFTGFDALNKLNEYGIKTFPAVNKLNPKNHLQLRFKKLFEGFSRNDRFRDNDLSCLFERVLIETGRSLNGSFTNTVLLNKSINYINEYFNKKIPITDLALMENVCMTTYNKYFKQVMGISPTKYIIELRMNSAKELLEFTDLSVTEIALTCGYTDLNFFSKVFKAEIGTPPSEYRRESRKYKIIDFDKNPVIQDKK